VAERTDLMRRSLQTEAGRTGLRRTDLQRRRRMHLQRSLLKTGADWRTDRQSRNCSRLRTDRRSDCWSLTHRTVHRSWWRN